MLCAGSWRRVQEEKSHMERSLSKRRHRRFPRDLRLVAKKLRGMKKRIRFHCRTPDSW